VVARELPADEVTESKEPRQLQETVNKVKQRDAKLFTQSLLILTREKGPDQLLYQEYFASQKNRG
jgi:hypothetical protein